MIKKAKIECEGTRPFLFNHLAINFLSTDRKSLSGSAGNNAEEWKDKVLYTKDNQLYIPSSYIIGAFKGGSLYTKVGRGTIMKKLIATLMVLDETILFDRHLPKNHKKLKVNNTEEDVYLDIRTVRNPNTKGSNLRYRIGLKKGYKFSFKIMWDDSIVSEDQMRNVARDAGMLVGIGDGRAIGLGRFLVEDFKIIK